MKAPGKKLGIFIILLGIAIFSWITYYAYATYKDLPNNFTRSRKNIGEKMYASLMALDLKNQYPAAPLDVMDVYADTAMLLYGDIIVNDELIKDVIGVQRQLYSDELLSKATEQEQFDEFKNSLETLQSSGFRMTKAEATATNYDPLNKDACVVNLYEYAINVEDKLEWNFHLIKGDDGKWKINTWELMNY